MRVSLSFPYLRENHAAVPAEYEMVLVQSMLDVRSIFNYYFHNITSRQGGEHGDPVDQVNRKGGGSIL